MREIKFRAWDNDKKTMVYGVEKFYDSLGTFYDGNGKELDIYQDTSLWRFSSFGSLLENKIPIMQYTGIKDKNGREIYDGDILNRGALIHSVRWDRLRNSWNISSESTMITFQIINGALSWDESNIEIIGNIYENKELLK